MKIVVCWEHSGEKPEAGRIAGMVRGFLRRFNIEVLTSSLRDDGTFGPYRNDAECLAAEAQRLLDAQEAAFGEHPPVVDDPFDMSAWTIDAVNGMRGGMVIPGGGGIGAGGVANPNTPVFPGGYGSYGYGGPNPVLPQATQYQRDVERLAGQTAVPPAVIGGNAKPGANPGDMVYLGDHLTGVKFYGVVLDSGDAATIEAMPGFEPFSEDGVQ